MNFVLGCYFLFCFSENIFLCSLLYYLFKNENKIKGKTLRNSCSQMFFKKVFLNIVKQTLVLESPFNKVAGLKVWWIFIKRETPIKWFSCEYCKISKNIFSIARFTTLGTKVILFIFLVSLLCFHS